MEGFVNVISLNWRQNKSNLLEYLKSRRYNVNYTQSILSHLERFVNVINKPSDIFKIFSNLTQGQQHNLNRALRVLFKFYEIEGIPESYLNALRKAIPQDNIGVDLRIPTEQEIIDSLRRLRMAPLKYQALYNLLLDSGLRIVEAERLVKDGVKDAVKVGSYHRSTLGYFRGCKLAYVAYFSEGTLMLIKKIEDSIEERNASGYFSKFGFLPPKYLRKYAFDKMISLSVPESVADFIEGRVPKKIGAKHYMALIRQADRFYGRYAKYLNRLRTLI